MPVLIDQSGPIENNWVVLGDAQTIPDAGNYIVTARRWFESRDELRRHATGGIGVILEPETDVARLRPDLDVLDLLAIQFSVFSDGRGFSQAQLLRQRYDYDKDIRAVGDVLRDQLSFMARCGINQFDLENEDDVLAALNAFSEFSVGYQSDIARHATA